MIGAGGSEGSPDPIPELGGACCPCGAAVDAGAELPDGLGFATVVVRIVVVVDVCGCVVVLGAGCAGAVVAGWLEVLGFVGEVEGTGAGGGTLFTGGCAGTV